MAYCTTFSFRAHKIFKLNPSLSHPDFLTQLLFRRSLGDTHARTLRCQLALGKELARQGKIDDAIVLLVLLLPDFEKTFGYYRYFLVITPARFHAALVFTPPSFSGPSLESDEIV